MARTVEAGIIINAYDQISTKMQNVKKNTTQTINEVAKANEKSAKATKSAAVSFNLLGGSIVVANQALGLAKKLYMAASNAINNTVGHTLEMRSKLDENAKAFDRLERSMSRSRATIGDALLPAAIGVKTVFAEMAEDVAAFAAANREIVAAKVADWALQVAGALISGVAEGVILVSRAWSGWKILINATADAALQSFAAIIQGSAYLVNEFAAFYDAVGAKEEAAENRRAASGVQKTIARLRKQADTYADTVGDEIRKLDEFEAKVRKVQASLPEYVAAGVAAARAAVAAGAGFYIDPKAVEEAKKAAQEIQEAFDRARVFINDTLNRQTQEQATKSAESLQAMVAANTKYWTDQADAAERNAKLMDQIENQRMARNQRIADRSAAFFFELGAAATKGGDKVAEAIGDMFGNLAIEIGKLLASKAIMFVLEILTGGIGTFFGFIGEALFGEGRAGTGATGGLVQEYANGGPVTGGMPGRDSVPAWVMPGEWIIPAHQVRANMAAGRAPDDSGSARGGGSINVTVHAGIAPSRSSLQEMTNNAIAPSIRRAVKTRRFDPLGTG